MASPTPQPANTELDANLTDAQLDAFTRWFSVYAGETKIGRTAHRVVRALRAERTQNERLNDDLDDCVDSLRVGRATSQQLRAALTEITGWFIPSGDDHMYALHPTRDFTAVTDVLAESPQAKDAT